MTARLGYKSNNINYNITKSHYHNVKMHNFKATLCGSKNGFFLHLIDFFILKALVQSVKSWPKLLRSINFMLL